MPRYFVYALEKGLAVLEAFNNRNSALGLTEIAKITHMNLSSTTRYLRTLTDLGYLHFDPDTDQSEAIIAHSAMKKMSPYTITDRAQLRKELKRCRREGYAVARQQLAIGWFNAAVPILMGEQVEGALGISYPMDFFEDRERSETLLKDLVQAGKEASYYNRV